MYESSVKEALATIHFEHILARTERKARKVIASLDRSPIGSYAVSEEALFLGLMMGICNRANGELHRASLLGKGSPVAQDASADVIYDTLRKLEKRGGRDGVQRTMGEVSFWGYGYAWYEVNNWHVDDYGDALAHLKLLRAVANTPVEFHEFFENDIWDYDLITGCISSDIDPSMALRMRAV